MELILASNSPRRKELLKQYGFEFTVVPSEYEERAEGLSPEDTVKKFALGKAGAVFDKLGRKDVVVLGSDTVVALGDEILGKPKTEDTAKKMLRALSGKTHYVYTGYAFIGDNLQEVFCEKTEVCFNGLSDALIEEYVNTKKPMDKAGAYGIQDGFGLVKSLNGSLNNVIGLPVEVFEKRLIKLLKRE